jgi:hypothetical protein
MKDLVFVKFNSRLKQKKDNKSRDPIEKTVADVLDDEDNEWVTDIVPNESAENSNNLQVLKVTVHHHHREQQQHHNRKGREVSSTTVIGRERG